MEHRSYVVSARRFLAILAVSLLALLTGGMGPGGLDYAGQAPSKPASSQAADAKRAITRVLEDQAAAWNRGDLKGFMAGYWNSPRLTFSSGKDQTRGWEATYERYRKRYQAEGREMGKLTFSELDIELLCPDSAYVRGRWKLVTSKETLGGVFTLVFRKLAEGWRIVHDHTSS